MEATRARLQATVFCVLLVLPIAADAESVRKGGAPKGDRATPVTPAERPDPSGTRGPAPAASTDPAAVRAETMERLKRLNNPGEKETKEPAVKSKALRELLEERLQWLKSWDEAVQARHKAEHPEPSPESQAAELKGDLERVKTLLEQAVKAPDSLLPASFRAPPALVSDTLRSEMKEAIESAQHDLKDWTAKLEKLRNDPAQSAGGQLTALRAERDKIHQRVVTLKTRRAERESALASAKTPEERALARERLINFEWESRVEQERLQGSEARIALEAKLPDLAALKLQVYESHILLAQKTVEGMQERFKAVAERAERALKQEAASEQKRAAKTDDPLERYRARRKAQLLELKAHVVKSENTIAAMTTAMEKQATLADRAEKDFASVKRLLDDGRISHLDALRLNNDFRRIGPERDQIVKNELAATTNQLTYYENALSSVEIALINDSRDDRYELEGLLELLPKQRHAEALNMFEEIEAEHTKLLERNRIALGALAALAEQSHDQVVRRLRILDDQYGFIRTHIFWVRDQEPVGKAMLWQAQREAVHLGKGVVHLVLEVGDRSLWGRVSPEFVLGALAVLILPWPLLRARRWLNPARRSSTLTLA